jgi:hypothetical protein
LSARGVRFIEDSLGRRNHGFEKLGVPARVPNVLDAGNGARLGGSEQVPGPGLLGGTGGRQEQNLANGFGAGNQHQGAAGLRNGGEVIEIVLLAEWPIHVTGVFARLGGVQNENAA